MSFNNPINHVANYLKVPCGNVTYENDNLIPVRINGNNVKTKGYYNIIRQLLNESNHVKDNLDDIQLRQWLEYIQVYVHRCGNSTQNINQVMLELNNLLSEKTYVLGHKLTVIDTILYYYVHKMMEKLTNQEKERYINVSRWFDNLQSDSNVRQKCATINFNTIYLCRFVTSK